MLSYTEALERILTDVPLMPTERIQSRDSLFRILAEDILADTDMPPFDKAAMDGYACRWQDASDEMQVLEVVAAGQTATQAIGRGQCIKIMTGALMPEGADTVIMVEQTMESGSGRIRFTGEKSSPNIIRQGEEIRKGQVVLQKGERLLPQHLAILATTGSTEPLVYQQVRVAILSTGDELVEPDQTPGRGMIRNSNAYQLIAQTRAAHCIPNYMGIIPDDEAATSEAVARALSENQVVLLSGGVSMGDFDFVPRILQENGVDILFRKVAVKPGRPTVYGRAGKTSLFGLPGYPVSSFINFETFVKPLLYAMMGHEHRVLRMKMPMGADFQRSKAERLEFLPVSFNAEAEVVPVRYEGSAHIHALCFARGLMEIPQGVREYKKGSEVAVRLL